MSLIMYTANYNYPMLLGDVLNVANDAESHVEIPVFMTNVPHLFEDSTSFPDKLRQKIYIIKDNLAICMAGFVSEMKSLLEDITSYFKYYDVTFTNFDNFWEQYDKESFSRSSCCFLIAEKDDIGTKIKKVFIGNWTTANSILFQEIRACGTGAARAIQEFSDIPSYQSNHTNYSQSIVTAHHCVSISKFIASEYFSASTLKDFWGAAFELIAYNGDKFIKIDDIGFLIWDIKYDKTGEISGGPVLAIDYKYYEDVLVLTVNNFKAIKRYGIIRLDQFPENINQLKISGNYNFSTKHIGCCYRVELPDNSINISSYYYEKIDDSAEDLISISLLPTGQVMVKVNNEFEKAMLNEVTELAKQKLNA